MHNATMVAWAALAIALVLAGMVLHVWRAVQREREDIIDLKVQTQNDAEEIDDLWETLTEPYDPFERQKSYDALDMMEDDELESVLIARRRMRSDVGPTINDLARRHPQPRTASAGMRERDED